jgi:hypothetical protein
MNLPQLLHARISEVCSSLSDVMGIVPDFSQEPETWHPAWKERSGMFEKALGLHVQLRPLIEQWEENKNKYSQSVRIAVQGRIHGLTATLKQLYSKNVDLSEIIQKGHKAVREQMLHLNKSSRAIVSYSSH